MDRNLPRYADMRWTKLNVLNLYFGSQHSFNSTQFSWWEDSSQKWELVLSLRYLLVYITDRKLWDVRDNVDTSGDDRSSFSFLTSQLSKMMEWRSGVGGLGGYKDWRPSWLCQDVISRQRLVRLSLAWYCVDSEADCDLPEDDWRMRVRVLRQLDGSDWSMWPERASVARNTKHNNSQALLGLLGPAASCPLKTCLAGRTEGGGGRVSSQDIGGREEKPLNLLSTIWTLYGHNRLLHCESNTVLYISQYHRAIQSCIFLCKYL